MDKDSPSAGISPRLHKHLANILDKKYGKYKLVEGWLVVQDGNGNPVKWEAREPRDCMNDLKKLAADI